MPEVGKGRTVESSTLTLKVKRTISRYQMLSPGQRVLVSVSGGPDSMALLLFLRELDPEYHLDLEVFHLDHMMRGEESREDARFVKEFCQELGYRCHLESFDVPDYVESRSLSPQEAAREVRNRLLDDCVDRIGASRIAVGHTADDQVETFLMRLMQGAGLSGLSGIPPVSGKIIRPLIEVWRKEIEGYCRLQGVEPRMDSSNLKPVYLRNRIRLELLPLLERVMGLGVKEVLLREVKTLREDNRFMEDMAEKTAGGILKTEEGRVLVDRSLLQGLPRAIQNRVIALAWENLNPLAKPLGYRHLEDIIEKVFGGVSGARIDLPGGVVVRREYDRVVIAPGEGEEVLGEEVELDIPGEVNLPWARVKVEAREVKSTDIYLSSDPWVEYVDLPPEEKRLILRPVSPGDRFWPLGVGGSKKIKDFFIDNKVPREERTRAVVVTSRGEIVWLVGYRLDERFRLKEGAEREICLTAQRMSDSLDGGDEGGA